MNINDLYGYFAAVCVEWAQKHIKIQQNRYCSFKLSCYFYFLRNWFMFSDTHSGVLSTLFWREGFGEPDVLWSLKKKQFFITILFVLLNSLWFQNWHLKNVTIKKKNLTTIYVTYMYWLTQDTQNIILITFFFLAYHLLARLLRVTDIRRPISAYK